MKVNCLLIVLLVIMLNTPVHGQELSPDIEVLSMEHTISLSMNSSSLYQFQVSFRSSQQNLTQLDLELELNIFNVTVIVDNNPAAVQINQESGNSVLTIVPIYIIPAQTIVKMDLQAEFTASYEVVEENSFQFFYNWNANWKSDNISVAISLPPHTILHQENDDYNIFPSTAIFTSDGRVITLVWSSLSNLSNANTQIFVQFDGPTASENTPLPTNNSTIIWILGGLLVVAIGLLIYVIWKYGYSGSDIKETKVIAKIKPVILSPQELDILKIISEHEGRLPQSDLSTILGVSRARVSQWLSKFEDMGLIKKYKIGRQNYVSLEEDVDIRDLDT